MIPEHFDYELPKMPPWWHGLAALIVMGILALIASCTLVDAATVNLVWNPVDFATSYKVYRISPEPRTLLVTVASTASAIQANEGDVVVVTAINQYGESPDSAPWTVRLPISNPVSRVTVQTSTDLNTWSHWQTFDLPESQARFFRLKIESP